MGIVDGSVSIWWGFLFLDIHINKIEKIFIYGLTDKLLSWRPSEAVKLCSHSAPLSSETPALRSHWPENISPPF